MKKNTIKAFTLVEMLIVIVIIGILIAALMPRMSAAQGRARDVARKTDLSQMQTAFLSYYGDHGHFPIEASSTVWTALSGTNVGNALKEMGMISVPADPQAGSKINIISGNGDDATPGAYRAKVVSRNNVSAAGLLLVSHVEVPGSANAVSCADDGHHEHIALIQDSVKFEPCTDIVVGSECKHINRGTCTYVNDDELVYVVAY